MDFNSYLMGVYGARNKNGLCGYHTIAKEMETLQLLYREGYEIPPPHSNMVVCGEFVGKSLLDGKDIRRLALKHLKEIWPSYFEGGVHPLPDPEGE